MKVPGHPKRVLQENWRIFTLALLFGAKPGKLDIWALPVARIGVRQLARSRTCGDWSGRTSTRPREIEALREKLTGRAKKLVEAAERRFGGSAADSPGIRDIGGNQFL